MDAVADPPGSTCGHKVLLFAMFTGCLTAEVFDHFLEKLVADTNDPVFLILTTTQ